MSVREVSMTKSSAVQEIPTSKLKKAVRLSGTERELGKNREKDWNMAKTMRSSRILSMLK